MNFDWNRWSWSCVHCAVHIWEFGFWGDQYFRANGSSHGRIGEKGIWLHSMPRIYSGYLQSETISWQYCYMHVASQFQSEFTRVEFHLIGLRKAHSYMDPKAWTYVVYRRCLSSYRIFSSSLFICRSWCIWWWPISMKFSQFNKLIYY